MTKKAPNPDPPTTGRPKAPPGPPTMSEIVRDEWAADGEVARTERPKPPGPTPWHPGMPLPRALERIVNQRKKTAKREPPKAQPTLESVDLVNHTATFSDGTVIGPPDGDTWTERTKPAAPTPPRSHEDHEKDERRIGHLAAQASAHVEKTTGRLREILTEIDTIINRWPR